MRNIWISDITIKNSGKAGGYSLSFKEKIELSKLLDRLGVSVIELSNVTNPKIDGLLIKSVAAAVKDAVVAVPVRLDDIAVETVWSALKEARHPRIQVTAPMSSVQMEYFCHRKPAAMISAIGERIAECRALCDEVEFIAEDAGRSESDFLQQAVSAAIGAGATVITLCDTAGSMLPDEFFDSIRSVYEKTPALSGVRLGVKCSNELFMADSCAVAAIRAGADEVKTSACVGDTASLESLTRILRSRGESMGFGCNIKATELQRTLGQIRWMCETSRSKASPFDNGVEDNGADGIVLTEHDDMTAVCKVVAHMGYDLSEEDSAKVYEAFTRIAAKKERVGARELDAIVAAAAMQVPPTYRVESYVINTGNIITASAHMRLIKDDRTLEGICVGDGPIDASFLAIEQIVGHHYELDDFQIQAVTEGHEAMGETVVKLRSEGKLYSGRGISTDIIGASIRAYVNALNKIVYEEAGE